MLAGGRSQRFGSDKLRATLDGRPLVRRSVEALAPVVGSVWLAVDRRARFRALRPLVGRDIRALVDVRGEFRGGPGGAILGALETARRRRVATLIVVPGDVPWMTSDALERLAAAAERRSLSAVAPYWPRTGRVETLVLALRPRAWDRTGLRALRARGRDLRASDFLRAAPRAGVVPARSLSRAPRCFVNVNAPAELARPVSRGSLSAAGRFRGIPPTALRAYRRAVRSRLAGRMASAARAFRSEARAHARSGLLALAEHARRDAHRPGSSAPCTPRPDPSRSAVRARE